MNQKKFPQNNNSFKPFDQSVKKETNKKSIIIGISVTFVFFVIVLPYILGLSTYGARDRARVAATKQSIQSTVPEVILCLDSGGEVVPPKNGGEMCSTNMNNYTWDDLSSYGGSWEGCEFGVTYDNEGLVEDFQYCGTANDGSVMYCDITGCTMLFSSI